jgi:hypothetical protein
MKLIQKIMRELESKELMEAQVQKLSLALEHHTYKNIPGTRNSYRQDSENTNTKTQKHAHIYAKPNGGGKEIYSVNMSGSGHDGSSGIVIPARHAELFRNLGYQIPLNLTLESFDFSSLDSNEYSFCIFEDVC